MRNICANDSAPHRIAQPPQGDRRGGSCNGETVLAHRNHCAGCRIRRSFFGNCLGNKKHPRVRRDLGTGQRVPIVTVVQRMHQRRDLARSLGEIQTGGVGGSVILGEIGALRQVLCCHDGGVTGQLVDHRGETVDRGGIAFCIQRQDVFVRGYVKKALRQQPAFVHAAFNQMPTDAVFNLTRQKRPNRRIQSRIARQGAIVKIRGTTCGQGQHSVGDHIKVGNG